MKITPEKIDELAHLARLQFEADEKARIQAELERILEFCEKLNEVNTEGVEPLIYLSDRVNNLRPDEVQMDITREEALRNAPDADSDYFRVPKVISKG
ncbi:MAG: Asp-tRNA(Asn)/Glu-tRNA(Gln) amidotransferase subunit GatC [Flavobacteriales bacterium]|nr:Asp-tRNA(Asn)/Glu-tRNA(Gln) amidotransferase subunit GatC [Flavobacteriales bacterium]